MDVPAPGGLGLLHELAVVVSVCGDHSCCKADLAVGDSGVVGGPVCTR